MTAFGRAHRLHIGPRTAGIGATSPLPRVPAKVPLDFARKGYRIRVNSMHPGTIDTDMGDQVLVTRARNLGTNDIEAARRQVIERLPIGRMGTPNDIAKGIVFLASDDAAFMTGAGLVIDGGITAQ